LDYTELKIKQNLFSVRFKEKKALFPAKVPLKALKEFVLQYRHDF